MGRGEGHISMVWGGVHQCDLGRGEGHISVVPHSLGEGTHPLCECGEEEGHISVLWGGGRGTSV